MLPPRCLNRHIVGSFPSRRTATTLLGAIYLGGEVHVRARVDAIPPRVTQVTALRHASTISTRLRQSAEIDRSLPDGVQVYDGEPLTVQKSVFVGRACRLNDPSHVPDILAWIMQQKGVAKAAHPIIHAWRCKVNGLVQQGDDDDGETAAGERLARVLELVEAENVLVIVTRYFGGVKLGPSRFKYISQAARSALDAGSLLSRKTDSSSKLPRRSGSSKKRR